MAMAYGLMALKIEIEQEDCGPVGPEPKTRERSLKRFPSSHFSNGCLYFVCFNDRFGFPHFSKDLYVSTFNCMYSLWNTTLFYTTVCQVVETKIFTAYSTTLL